MKLVKETDIYSIIQNDLDMMEILTITETLQLSNWWIGAGFLRNKIWDVIEETKTFSKDGDVDVVYFDKNNTNKADEKAYEKRLFKIKPDTPWSVKNQARMHHVNKIQPFISTEDGIAHWPETATAIAVKIHRGKLQFLFCYGLDDLLNLRAKPTPYFKDDLIDVFRERVQRKQWQQRWPDLKIIEE